MDEKTYLERHHHETETMIGLARLHLKNGDAEKAKEALDRGCGNLDKLSEERMGPEMVAKARAVGLID